MSEQWGDDIEQLSDLAFMQMFRHPYHHNRLVRARLDAIQLPRYGPLYRRPNTGGPPSRVEAEKVRRSLTYPDDWIAAGLEPGK